MSALVNSVCVKSWRLKVNADVQGRLAWQHDQCRAPGHNLALNQEQAASSPMMVCNPNEKRRNSTVHSKHSCDQTFTHHAAHRAVPHKATHDDQAKCILHSMEAISITLASANLHDGPLDLKAGWSIRHSQAWTLCGKRSSPGDCAGQGDSSGLDSDSKLSIGFVDLTDEDNQRGLDIALPLQQVCLCSRNASLLAVRQRHLTMHSKMMVQLAS